MFRKLGILCVIVSVLSGCGALYSNGSGSGGTTVYTGQAQGAFSGTLFNQFTLTTLVLPNDKFYGVYGTTSGVQFFPTGIVVGNGASGNDSYTANVVDFTSTGSAISDSLTATDVPGASITGTILENGTSISFSGTAVPAGLLNYNTPASVASISGSWTGELLDQMATTVTIDSSGNVSGNSAGCSFTGTFVADSSNKNFYDVTFTFGASPCANPNQTETGVGLYYLLSDNTTHQLLAVVTSGSAAGTVFFAQR
jgi:hypothetical protein